MTRVKGSVAGEDPRIERSRAVVREAVVEELADVGYGALTIESVARRAGVGKSTIYRHWDDKVDLIADAFEHAHHDAVPDVENGSARDRLIILVAHVAEVIGDGVFSRCIPALIEGAERDPRLRRFHIRYAAVRRSEMAGVIAEGIANGELFFPAGADSAAVAILGTLFYRRLMTTTPLKLPDAGTLVDALLGPLRRSGAGARSSRAAGTQAPRGKE